MERLYLWRRDDEPVPAGNLQALVSTVLSLRDPDRQRQLPAGRRVSRSCRSARHAASSPMDGTARRADLPVDLPPSLEVRSAALSVHGELSAATLSLVTLVGEEHIELPLDAIEARLDGLGLVR